LEEIESANTPPLTPPRQGGENFYTIFLRKENFEEYRPKNQNFKKALWDVPWYGWREQMQNVELRMQNFNVVHFPHWNVPLFFNRPFVVTIHDLELFSSNRTRENSTRGRLTYWFKFQMFKIIFRHAVLASRAIIVPSHFVKEQLLDLYPQVKRKVSVIYEAPTIIPSTRYTLHVTRYTPYALYVGSAYPHKNLPRLLEAWQIISKEFPDHKLVLVGREDFFWRKLKMQNAECRMQNIVFYGAATDEELATLYENAALLVQPSLTEGFSLPPLEALSFGCPVAVSDIPIHHEILKDSAFYFNPHYTQSLHTVIKNALRDAPLRSQTVRRGQTIIQGYSWGTHAQQTQDLYLSRISLTPR